MRSQKTRELVLFGALTAVVFVAQVLMGFLPNLELVTLLLLLYTVMFGRKVFFIIYVFVLLEGFFYGFGLWWINYLYVWSVQALITLIFRKQDSVVFWSILSGFYGITFGALCAIPYFFMGGASSAFAYWVSGVAYDIPHCIGNVLLCLLLYRPLRQLLEQAVKGIGVSP
ncbi:MAG TPA: hypothetical protein IAB98_03390 [Candidatus Egerieimonas intestinavium]|uniref:Energy-coupling factor transport system substrate-specific component n=1 Tax=Candidatus Egerieimonas intestinavium TaxID=2840777 RepID=A0A9D1EIV1_9FIRM|nr:hypothetical protein [Candidatus Egerieimonas intestinavium]